MTTRVRFITHEGREILVTDLAGLEGAEILAPILEAAKVIRSRAPDSVLTLTDATRTGFSLRDESGDYDRITAEAIRSCIAGNRPYVKAATIVVGGDENKRILVEFFNKIGARHFTVFDSVEDACAWLVAQ